MIRFYQLGRTKINRHVTHWSRFKIHSIYTTLVKIRLTGGHSTVQSVLCIHTYHSQLRLDPQITILINCSLLATLKIYRYFAGVENEESW